MKNFNFFFQVIFLLICGIVCFIFLKEYDFSTIKELSLITIFFLLLIRVLNFGIYQLSSYYLFTSFNEKISISNLILINNCSSVSNYATPVKIGFPIQAFLLKKIFNIPYKKSVIIILASVIISVLTSSILSILAIFFLLSILNISMKLSLLSLAMLILVLSISIVIFFIKDKVATKLFNDPIIKKINQLIHYLRKVNFLRLCLSVILGLTTFFINAIMLKIIIVSLNENVDISLLFIIQGMPFLLGMVSMVPLGLGVKDATLSYLLTLVGITPEVAIISSVILRIFMSGFSILIGIFSANYLFKKNISLIVELKKMKSKYIEKF